MIAEASMYPIATCLYLAAFIGENAEVSLFLNTYTYIYIRINHACMYIHISDHGSI